MLCGLRLQLFAATLHGQACQADTAERIAVVQVQSSVDCMCGLFLLVCTAKLDTAERIAVLQVHSRQNNSSGGAAATAGDRGGGD